MGIRDEQRDRVVQRLSAHLLETGLSRTSLRQLAAAAEVSDRMLLYYFADKAEVLAAAMQRIAADLAGGLAHSMPEGERLPPAELALRAAELTMQPEMRRFMRLWIEVVAEAGKGREPFAAIAGAIMGGFVAWIDSRLDAPPEADRAGLAAAVIAVIDGLALVDLLTPAGTAPAARAAFAVLLRRP